MKRLFFALIAVVTMATSAIAQQDPHYSHFMFNQAGYNPAFCGTEGAINAVLVYRNQWMGMDGAPKTANLCVDAPVRFLGAQGGVGAFITSDNIGFEKNFNAKAAYAHHIQAGTGVLSIGIAAGIFNKNIEGDWQFPDQHEAIFEGKVRKMIFDLDAGIYYNVKGLTLGFSSTHVAEPALDFSEDGETYLARHYYFVGSYNINLSNTLFDLTPSMILMSDGKTMQADININILYNKKVWGGVTYRNGDAITLLAGLTVMNDIKVGLAYEVGVSKLRKTNSGSFEVMMGYSFMPERSKPAQKVRSVRFL
ncbi:MAG: type IX secretion system membrane protein PorP/SprF [Bacteroidales bacterium]|nr:type IX secretion system membrane protein PorP/SprF [Bacteroidales bacterium]